MKKIKILLTFFVATLLILGILSQLSVWYDNRTAEPAKRLLQSEVPRGDSEGADAMWLMTYDIPDAAERRQIMAKLGNKVPEDDKLPENQRTAELPNVLARYGSPSRELHYDPEAKAIVFTPYQHHVRFILNVPLALPQGQQNEMTDKLPKSHQ